MLCPVGVPTANDCDKPDGGGEQEATLTGWSNVWLAAPKEVRVAGVGGRDRVVADCQGVDREAGLAVGGDHRGAQVGCLPAEGVGEVHRAGWRDSKLAGKRRRERDGLSVSRPVGAELVTVTVGVAPETSIDPEVVA